MEYGMRLNRTLFQNAIFEKQNVFVFLYSFSLQKLRIGDVICFERDHETCRARVQEMIFFQEADRVFDHFFPVELGYRDEKSFFSSFDPEEVRIYGLIAVRIALNPKFERKLSFSYARVRDKIERTRSMMYRWKRFGEAEDITGILNKYKKKYLSSQDIRLNADRVHYFDVIGGKLKLVQEMIHPIFYPFLAYILDMPEGVIRSLSQYGRCILVDEDGIISSFEGYKGQRYFQENPDVLTGSQAIRYLLNQKTMERRKMDLEQSGKLSESVYYQDRMDVLDAFLSGKLGMEDVFIDFVPISAFTIEHLHDTEHFLCENVNSICFKIFLRGERIRKMKEKTPIPVTLEFYSKYCEAIEQLTQMIRNDTEGAI